ncbi:MAG: GNAT family N-acetyltransferase [Clostridia bacterium]|nr:GNAT family N-acetyltransferase [Clostridia bacterium]
MYDWWGAEEGYSFDAVKCYMAHSMGEERLPQTYGLFLDGKIIGMYQFTQEDLFVRPDIYPWLANVYIDKPYRKMGYGGSLLQSVKNNAAKSLSGNEVFLFTKHIGLYEKYGWQFVSEIDTFLGESSIERLYRLDLR